MEKEEILTTERVVERKEILNYYLNMFRDKQIAGVIDLAHYSRIKEREPNYETMQNGQRITVDQLIDAQKKTILFARENIKYIEELLRLDQDGKLAEKWADEVVLSPIEKYEESKNEETK